MKKLFVIKKYVWATSAIDALRKEKKIKPDDCWIDSEWQKNNCDINKDIGFKSKKK